MIKDNLKVEAVGRIGSIEMRYLPSGTPVTTFSVAVDTGYWDKTKNERVNQTAWTRWSAFGPMAETINRVFQVGKPIQVEGVLSGKYDLNGKGERVNNGPNAYVAKSGDPRANWDFKVTAWGFVPGDKTNGTGAVPDFDSDPDAVPTQNPDDDLPF